MIWSDNPEPHYKRRDEILNKYPEIKKLMGYDPKSKYMCILLVLSQIVSCLYVKHLSWMQYLSFAYFVGATITQALFLAIHELTHNLFFKSPRMNRYFAMFVNLPILFPFAIIFKEYHLEHHKHQGVYGIDTDLPSKFEVSMLTTSTRRFIWLMFQIVAYAIRPILTNPKPITQLQIYNILLQCTYNYTIYTHFGPSPLKYLLLCILISGGLHPCSGHFISEHYSLDGSQETYSYYGSLNALTWNVGYHNEHHDFPTIPGSRLPQVLAQAPEVYHRLDHCKSWYKTLFSFILYNHVRVKRKC
jgi:sphingolipid delta-4 desaturase